MKKLIALLPSLIACLIFVGTLTISCGSHVNWPKLGSCLEPAAPALLETVATVLMGTGDVKEELSSVASTYAPAAIECAVKQVVDDVANGPRTARASHVAARGSAFLESVER